MEVDKALAIFGQANTALHVVDEECRSSVTGSSNRHHTKMDSNNQIARDLKSPGAVPMLSLRH